MLILLSKAQRNDEGEFIFIIFKECIKKKLLKKKKKKILEDNKYKFTFIMDQPRSETVFNKTKRLTAKYIYCQIKKKNKKNNNNNKKGFFSSPENPDDGGRGVGLHVALQVGVVLHGLVHPGPGGLHHGGELHLDVHVAPVPPPHTVVSDAVVGAPVLLGHAWDLQDVAPKKK